MMTQDHNAPTTRNLAGGKTVTAGAMMLALAACVAPMPAPETDTDTGFITTLPAQVIALADPSQNLQAVRIMQDGCYWYEHTGPVETTMLPLRTPSGSPICTARSS